jgi:putative ABC transport system ATP-binding protein
MSAALKPWIRLEQVNKIYETPAGAVHVLHDIDLRIERGEFVAIIGKSGSGKSTLLNMLTGIDRPTTGEVWVGETAVHRLGESQMALWRGKNLGIVFQFFQLLPTLSLLDNVMLPMDFANRYPLRERRERALALLERVEMRVHADKLPSAISGGQQQRAAIARALANDPPLVVADEPTGNLDSATADSIFELFGQLVAQGKTIVMVTHDNDLARRATRTIVVADGEIVNTYVARALTALDINQLSLVAANLEPAVYPPGASIIRQGDTADKFFIIVQGECDVTITHPGGAEILVNHLSPGEYFGEMALVRGGTRTANVHAWNRSPVQVMTLDRATFDSLAEDSLVLKQELERIITERLDRAARANERGQAG